MFGDDYEIIYMNGCNKVVIDSLPCQFEDKGTMLFLSLPIPYWIEESCHEWFFHTYLSRLTNKLR